MIKVAPDTKRFDGKRYHFVMGVATKKEALGKADMYRAQGYRVRTAKINGIRGYFIYINGLGYR